MLRLDRITIFVIENLLTIMNVSLTQNLEDYVKNKVESGLYNSASEVIREGLRALREKEIDSKIRAGLQQVEQGKTVVMDDDFVSSIVATIEERLTAKK